MKIAHLIFDLNIGGAETMLVDIINEQVKTEQVLLIVINDQIDTKLLAQIDNRVQIILIRRKEKSRNPLPIFKLNWYLIVKNPDVIHCHHQAAIRMIAIKNNTVLTAHTTGVKTNNISKYNRVFAISNTVKNDIEKRSSVKPIVIYNGIKIEQVKQKVDYNFSIFKIVQVGRLDHEIKGQHILLKALKIIVYEKGVKNISVDFIGEGKSLDYLNGLVKEYHLEDYISFLGMRDRKFIYEHLKDYNLLVQPSLYEGFGLTIVEAMAAKVPVLVSDIEGPLEIIGNGIYGWIFESNNGGDCASNILNIISIYEEVKLKLDDSYKHIFTNFNITNTSKLYLKYYLNPNQIIEK
jgi:glycosyltransferase involved in cell wall biosynthesis